MFATQRNPQRDQPSGRQSHKLTGAAARSQSEHHIPPSTCRILESSGFRRAAGRAPHRPGVVGAPIAVSWTSNSAVNLRSWSARVKRRRRRRNLGDLEVEWGRRAVTVLPGSVWTPLERMLEAERQTFFRWEVRCSRTASSAWKRVAEGRQTSIYAAIFYTNFLLLGLETPTRARQEEGCPGSAPLRTKQRQLYAQNSFKRNWWKMFCKIKNSKIWRALGKFHSSRTLHNQKLCSQK